MLSEKIVNFITTNIAPDVDADEIALDYDLFEGGVLDSLAIVRLIAWIGETFSLPINDIDIIPTDLHTINGIAEFVKQHTKAQLTAA